MVITENNVIWPVRSFAAGLDSLRAAVFQLIDVDNGENRSYYSGWLITRDILICPDFRPLNEHSIKTIKAFRDGISYETIFLDELIAESQRIVLLRLIDFSGSALPIYMRNVVADTPVIVMQYPYGQIDASFSIGQITEGQPPLISYIASTVPGSAGGPVVHAATWAVMGIHLMASVEKYNSGVTMGSVLDALVPTTVWPEIRDTHHLIEAEPSISRQATPTPVVISDEILFRAAISWQFAPSQLSDEERSQIATMIIDVNAPFWILKTPDRQRLMRVAGLDRLRKLSPLPGSERHMGQQLVEELLFNRIELNDVAEGRLPFYFQIARWLRPLLPQLPEAAAIRRRMEQLRLKSRLKQISGDDFEGRYGQLRNLNQWYNRKRSGPLVLSGIGGVGKSALLAHFALNLDPMPLVIWLDFDRADLAPDDHRSLAEAFYEQVAVQLDTEIEIVDTEDTQQADKLAKRLARLVGQSKPLVVLDGFEVAQHVEQYHDIWNFFESLLDQIPEMKIIISGRSDVPNLILDGRPANNWRLEGLAKVDARTWLRRHIQLPVQQEIQVIEVSRGIPLILRLSSSFIQKGGDIGELLGANRPVLIEGFLYQRVLDRVIDSRLKELSKDALVLRKINLLLMNDVLSGRLPVNMTAEEAFKSLSREMGLVNERLNLTNLELSQSSEDLYLKPEVRNATLALLEESEPDRVAEIDRLAAAYYHQTDMTDPDNAAEYIYHVLRLGRIDLAETAWTSASYYLLRNAVEEINDRAAQRWLERKLEEAYQDAHQAQLFWEKDSFDKIRSLLSRGHNTYIQEVLDQRSQRTKGSLLYIYDAWMLWRSGSIRQALKVGRMALRKGRREPVDFRSHVFTAFLASEAGDFRQSDRLLYEMEHGGFTSGPLDFRGARIRLFSSLSDELRLEKTLLKLRSKAKIDSRFALFTATDFMRKPLKEAFLDNGRESNFRLSKHISSGSPEELLTFLNEGTFRTFLKFPGDNCTFTDFERFNRDWKKDFVRNSAFAELSEKEKKELLDLALRIAFRWYLISLPGTLDRIAEAFTQKMKTTLAVADLLSVAIYENVYFAIISNLRYTNYMYSIDSPVPELVSKTLRRNTAAEIRHQSLIRDLIERDAPELLGEVVFYQKSNSRLGPKIEVRPEVLQTTLQYPLVQYLLFPEPLDLLAKQALELPENIPLGQ